ncbi:MAG: glycosyltransferase [Verrucomicrobiales bacterium]|nr:glycosyltransferase [Verrucomicrobiales bacterium]
MKILATSPLIPRPDTASGDRRFAAILKLLARRVEVDFCSGEPLPSRESPDQRHLRALEKINVRVVAGGTEGIHQCLSRNRYDAVFSEFWAHSRFIAHLIRQIQPWTPVVVDSVDVHFLREEAAAQLGLHDPRAVAERKEQELAVYRAAHTVVAITEDDEVALLREGGISRILRLPNIVESRSRHQVDRGDQLLFVGGFAHPPNRDAVHWFVTEILPRIRARIPNAILRVVGNKPPPDIVALNGSAGVQVIGSVPETGPYLDAAAVSVAPLRYGAGMKGKVTEALAAGLPVVTTAVGAQGLHAVSGEHLVIADEAAAFAEAVVQLLLDPDRAARLGQSGQHLILSLCGETAATNALNHLIADLANHRQPPIAPLRMLAYRMARSLTQLGRPSPSPASAPSPSSPPSPHPEAGSGDRSKSSTPSR